MVVAEHLDMAEEMKPLQDIDVGEARGCEA